MWKVKILIKFEKKFSKDGQFFWVKAKTIGFFLSDCLRNSVNFFLFNVPGKDVQCLRSKKNKLIQV